MADKHLITAQRLRELLNYDPETGIFTWHILPTRGNARLNPEQAGGKDRKGHIRICINQKYYAAHRLAWLYIHDEWPSKDIDHHNGIPSDNRIVNLREATSQENRFNEKLRSSNTSGYKGVLRHPQTGRWRASIWINYKRIHLGYFATAEEAAAAYNEAAAGYHGEFYRDTR